VVLLWFLFIGVMYFGPLVGYLTSTVAACGVVLYAWFVSSERKAQPKCPKCGKPGAHIGRSAWLCSRCGWFRGPDFD
jgi:hypothetical protein